METKFYTVDEAAAILKMCTKSIRRHVKSGAIESVKIAGRVLILAGPISVLATSKEKSHAKAEV